MVRSTGGSLLLRVDDADDPRMKPEFIGNVFDTIKHLGIDYDQGPESIEQVEKEWSQKWRLGEYETLLQKLIETGDAYACTCSRKMMEEPDFVCKCFEKRLPLSTPESALRVKTRPTDVFVLQDLKKGTLALNVHQLMPDFVIRRKDKIPAYQVTSLSDDIHYHINLIVRGEDLLPSTAAQLFLARLAGCESFTMCQFLHHGLISDNSGEKLSKSKASSSFMQQYGSLTSLPLFFIEFSRWMEWEAECVSAAECLLYIQKYGWANAKR